MGLSSEMKSLSEEIITSFKQRIKETEKRAKNNIELVNEVQKTLDGFRKDHQEMAAVLNANAVSLRKGLENEEKERLDTYKGLMDGIHTTISSIQKEVLEIQASTFNLINEFTANRAQMAVELDKFFVQGRSDRMGNEENRMKKFDAFMKNIKGDIKSINAEVLVILKNTEVMLDRFEKEHLEMSTELRVELSKNMVERVEYTRILLDGFQKKLSEISNENQQMTQRLKKNLANGEVERLNEYKDIMNGIHVAIKGIRKEVNDFQKATAGMLGDFSQDRGQASDEWKKMQNAITQLREKGIISSSKEVVKKVDTKEVKKGIPVEKVQEAPVKAEPKPIVAMTDEKVMGTPDRTEPKSVIPMTLEEKILDFINKHPKGVKVSEMEKPLGETRMKLGFVAKNLLNAGKVQKMENLYLPLK